MCTQDTYHSTLFKLNFLISNRISVTPVSQDSCDEYMGIKVTPSQAATTGVSCFSFITNSWNTLKSSHATGPRTPLGTLDSRGTFIVWCLISPSPPSMTWIREPDKISSFNFQDLGDEILEERKIKHSAWMESCFFCYTNLITSFKNYFNSTKL